MKTPLPLVWLLLASLVSMPLSAPASTLDAGAPREGAAEALVIGETFTLQSAALGETRRINLYRPAAAPADQALPVLYMPDGGLHEDFLHIAGLLQVSSGNGTMRPFLLVGIENTQRRRDLTGPTEVADDRAIAPVVGGSAAFRAFLRDELMPEIARRHRVTDEAAIVGESLAGLFVLETLVESPGLFDAYIAIDPSLWWNAEALAGRFETFLAAHPGLQARLFIAHSAEPSIAGTVQRLRPVLERAASAGLRWELVALPEESHSTVFHPAALRAFRALLAPAQD